MNPTRAFILGVLVTGTLPAQQLRLHGATHESLPTQDLAIAQTIVFDAIPTQLLGGSPFAIAVQASSGLPVTVTSTTPTICKNATNLVMLLNAGTCSLTATQAGGSGYTAALPVTQNFTVNVALPSGTLLPGNPLTAVGVQGVGVGDFNGDGFADIATASPNSGNVAVFLGSASGAFTAAPGSPFFVQRGVQGVAAGDFDGDGRLDLAVMNSGNDNVTIWLGDGLGGFTETAGGAIPLIEPNSITVGDFNGDGIQDLMLPLTAANQVAVLLGDGAGGFAPASGSPFDVGITPLSAAVGDFNGDGFQDVVVSNLSDSTVTVLLGSQSGALTPATGSPFATGLHPQGVAVGDFNGDGFADIATADRVYGYAGDVSVLLGDGLGGFMPASGSPFAAGIAPLALAIADFNGDGIPDIAVANTGDTNLTLLFGNGGGGFSQPPAGLFPVGASPVALAVGDFNGDGTPDLASANGDTVSVLFAKKFPTTSALSTLSPSVIALGQEVPLTVSVTGSAYPFVNMSGSVTFLDGRTSLGTATQSGSPYTLSISSLGVGVHTLTGAFGGGSPGIGGSTSNAITITVSGTLQVQTISFTPTARLTPADSPLALTASASSALPVTLTSNTTSVCKLSGNVLTLLTLGACSLTATQDGDATYAAALAVTRIIAVAAPQTITFDAVSGQLLGISPFELSAKATSGLPVTFLSTTPAICSNASGLVTLLTVGTCSIEAMQAGSNAYIPAPTETRSFTVRMAKGWANLTAATGSPFAAGTAPSAMATGDFNGDGIPDIAVANQGSNNVTVLIGSLSGGFTAATGSPFSVGAAPDAIVVGDFNADGSLDLAVANFNGDSVTVLLANGSGGFTATTKMLPVGSRPAGLTVGDFNDDGFPDLATADIGSNSISVLLGDGSGGFTVGSGNQVQAGSGPKGIAVGDFNGDGVQDLAIVGENFTDTPISILLGDSAGGFTASTPQPGAFFGVAGAIGDFNHDGFPDVASVSFYGSVAVLLGGAATSFSTPDNSPFSVGKTPAGVVVADLNGDGVSDLAVANSGDGTVSVLLGDGAGNFVPAAGSPFQVGSNPAALAVADFNGDGVEDLAVANNLTGMPGTVTVLLGGQVGTTSVLTTTTPSHVAAEQVVTLTLTVSDNGTAIGGPTGTATFYDGVTVLATALQNSSPYTFSGTLAPGSHTLSATYGGGSGRMPSSSNSITIQSVSRCDANGDLKTDITDLQSVFNQAMGLRMAANDLHGGSGVNLVDVQIVIDVLLNLGCTAS